MKEGLAVIAAKFGGGSMLNSLLRNDPTSAGVPRHWTKCNDRAFYTIQL
jgi:hypothetical protein